MPNFETGNYKTPNFKEVKYIPPIAMETAQEPGILRTLNLIHEEIDHLSASVNNLSDRLIPIKRMGNLEEPDKNPACPPTADNVLSQLQEIGRRISKVRQKVSKEFDLIQL